MKRSQNERRKPPKRHCKRAILHYTDMGLFGNFPEEINQVSGHPLKIPNLRFETAIEIET